MENNVNQEIKDAINKNDWWWFGVVMFIVIIFVGYCITNN